MNRHAYAGSLPATSQFVIPLGEPLSADPAVAGVKAANLAALLRAGFAVPDGVVLSADAFDALLLLVDPEDILPATLPDEIDIALQRVLAALGDGKLAVRSSAVAEDMPGASYAGQYETVLGVQGLDQLRSAVRHCWASAFSERATAYRARQADTDRPRMALLIQRLIEADAAGVAFTVDPVSGDRNVTLVSAMRGLGDRLVSGEVTPDEWVVSDTHASLRQRSEGAIDEPQARQVATLARRVERHFGAPQDIEWAIAGGELHLLQARPVTGIDGAEHVEPIKPEFVIPQGLWQGDSAHSSRPLSPMSRSTYLPACERAVTSAFREFGMLLDRIECREIGGYFYMRIVPPGGKEGPAPPWWVLAIVVRVLPDARAAVKRARDAERTGLGARLMERWWGGWREELFQRIEVLRSVDLPGFTDDALEAHIASVLVFIEEGITAHFRLFVPYLQAVAAFAMFCRDELGWDARKAMETVDGLSTMSSEPARGLSELASMARRRPAAAEVLARNEPDALGRLREIDPELAGALDAYQRIWGLRALGEDVMEPTLGERPAITLSLLRGAIAGGRDVVGIDAMLTTRREAAAGEAREQLSGTPEKLARFEELLAGVRRVYPVREDNSFPTCQAPFGLLRLGVLEAGRRLALRGVIAREDDVMYLELPEALSGLAQGGDMRALMTRRKGEYAWALQNRGPASYGPNGGPPPDMRGVPAEARNLMQALMWFIANDIDAPVVDGGGLRGIAASGGVYRGPVRVIRSEDEFHKLRFGDVLVCPITSPVWSVLFSSAGALVTDTGGVLSHSAIVAREHGIPAIVATGTATSVLRDGQIVTVDGNRGEIRVEGDATG